MYQVLGLAFDGFQASGLATTFDVFNVVNTLWHQRGESEALYQCGIVSAAPGAVRASNGMRINSDYTLDSAPKPDLIIIPGLHHRDSDDLIRKLGALERLHGWLAGHARNGCLIAANCSGVFLLADSGALNNQSATTAWWLNSLFDARYPSVTLRSDTLIVENRHSYCTGAMTANLGAMLQIVERQVGRQIALACARTMLIDANQSYASPYLFVQEQSPHQDTLVLAVESWMQRHINQPFDLSELAALHCVSERTLSRRFKKAQGISPHDYLQRLRLEHTRLLLETTNLTVEQLVERVGYSNASSLRRLFANAMGMSPRAYRQHYKAQREADAESPA